MLTRKRHHELEAMEAARKQVFSDLRLTIEEATGFDDDYVERSQRIATHARNLAARAQKEFNSYKEQLARASAAVEQEDTVVMPVALGLAEGYALRAIASKQDARFHFKQAIQLLEKKVKEGGPEGDTGLEAMERLVRTGTSIRTTLVDLPDTARSGFQQAFITQSRPGPLHGGPGPGGEKLQAVMYQNGHVFALHYPVV